MRRVERRLRDAAAGCHTGPSGAVDSQWRASASRLAEGQLTDLTGAAAPPVDPEPGTLSGAAVTWPRHDAGMTPTRLTRGDTLTRLTR